MGSVNAPKVGGPLWMPELTCRWCGRVLRHMWNGDRFDDYYDPDNRIMCTPADRSAVCTLGYYANPLLMGDNAFDPLTLKGHDVLCSCQASFPHTPAPILEAQPYPWPDLLPYHCDQPMMMRHYHPDMGRGPGAWHCRGCRATVKAAPDIRKDH